MDKVSPKVFLAQHPASGLCHRRMMSSGHKIRASIDSPSSDSVSSPSVVSQTTGNYLRAFRGLVFQKYAQYRLEMTQTHMW